MLGPGPHHSTCSIQFSGEALSQAQRRELALQVTHAILCWVQAWSPGSTPGTSGKGVDSHEEAAKQGHKSCPAQQCCLPGLTNQGPEEGMVTHKDAACPLLAAAPLSPSSAITDL